MRASSVVNRQSTPFASAFRFSCQAWVSERSVSKSGIRRHKHCRVKTLSSISAMFAAMLRTNSNRETTAALLPQGRLYIRKRVSIEVISLALPPDRLHLKATFLRPIYCGPPLPNRHPPPSRECSVNTNDTTPLRLYSAKRST